MNKDHIKYKLGSEWVWGEIIENLPGDRIRVKLANQPVTKTYSIGTQMIIEHVESESYAYWTAVDL